jgi:hypothetical protein
MADVAAFNHYGTFNLPMTEGDRAIVMSGAGVTANFFDVLGAAPALGRLLRSDDRDSASPVTVISFRSWQHRLLRRRRYRCLPASAKSYTSGSDDGPTS